MAQWCRRQWTLWTNVSAVGVFTTNSYDTFGQVYPILNWPAFRPRREFFRVMLCFERTRSETSFGACSFSVARHIIWNFLPPSLRTCSSPDTFCRHLKTHYCHTDFEMANITFRTLHCSQPAYLRSSLHVRHSTRFVRLSNTNLLSAPFVRTSFGSRSSSVAAPKIWYISSSPQDPRLPIQAFHST